MENGKWKMENGNLESGPISNFQFPISNPPTRQRGDGIVLGEGTGVFVLETTAHAAARGAAAWAHLTGVGLARSRRRDSGDGLERAIRAALQEAGRRPEEVDAVFASANGWPAVDAEEAAALRAVFPAGVPVTALKSRWGEPVGAGVALNLAAALAAFADGQIPATIGRGGPLCQPVAAGLDLVTDPRPADLRVALLTSVDFGGGCVSLVVER
jgi:3-oxoacyl-(acyl-carrier-protein) synthase